jgi:hypothetical protein
VWRSRPIALAFVPQTIVHGYEKLGSGPEMVVSKALGAIGLGGHTIKRKRRRAMRFQHSLGSIQQVGNTYLNRSCHVINWLTR